MKQGAANWRNAIALASQCDQSLVEALSELALAENERTNTMNSRLSMAKKALETFTNVGANFERSRAIMLLVRLEPTRIEFREMAKSLKNEGRRTSSAFGRSQSKADAAAEKAVSMETVPLAGRKEELTLLMNLANKVRTGQQCHPICIMAPPGMGKSALVRTFMEDVTTSMKSLMDITLTAAREFDTKSPFFVWRRIFHSLLKLQSYDE